MPNYPVRQAEGSELSQAHQDYLKLIYQLTEEDLVPATTSALSSRLGVAPPSVTEMLAKLATRGLVVYERRRGASLTGAGRRLALEMVRHHRLIESYLSQVLGYSWDEVHDEAERLEHVISERLESRIASALGETHFDPHGDPIPSPEGNVPERLLHPLPECQPGQRVTVARVADQDPDKLRELARLSIRPGSQLRVIERSRWRGPVLVQARRRRCQIPLGLAQVVLVEVRDDG